MLRLTALNGISVKFFGLIYLNQKKAFNNEAK